MAKKHEIKLVILGVIAALVLIFILWTVENKKINLLAAQDNAASLSISPAYSQIYFGGETAADIVIDGKNLRVASVETIISYNPELISIVDQDASRSGIQIFADELFSNYYANSVDAKRGLIRLSADLPKGQTIAVNEPRVLAKIIFVPLKVASSIKFDFIFKKGASNDSNVFGLSDDGKSIDFLQAVFGADYHF